MTFSDHLIILPILLPLATGALLLMFDDRSRNAKALLNLVMTLLLLAVSVSLVLSVSPAGAPVAVTYSVGNWPVPFGIVLVADRLSAMMVLLTSILGLSALIYSLARWHGSGPSFHSLFQFLLMGLNGAFLTGDIFNLFVFFEVLLAASYGLALHGVGVARVKAGLHYIAINLAGSFLFLIGAALIYGVTGTLNMADLAVRIGAVAEADRGLLDTGLVVLGLAFLLKAGMWPLGFWLPATYSVAAPPVAALFAIMTKVGIYAILRLSTLVVAAQPEGAIQFGHTFLIVGGLATLAFGIAGMLASQGTARLAAFCLLVSSGTLLGAIGMGNPAVTSGALYYLVVSTMAISAFFLLVELLERVSSEEAHVLALTLEAFGDDEEENEEQEVGLVIPGPMAMVGISFVLCALLIAGLPPLGGFVAKFAMISAMFNPDGLTQTTPIAPSAWWMTGLLVFGGLAALVAFTRKGISTFWVSLSETPSPVRFIEVTPILLLLGLTVLSTILAGPILDYMTLLTDTLYAPGPQVAEILATPGRGLEVAK